MKRIALTLILLAAFAASTPAEGTGTQTSLEIQAFYGPPNHASYGGTGFAPVEYGAIPGDSVYRDIGSSWGSAGAKAIFKRMAILPALAGEGPLVKNNNIALAILGELTPVSLNANLEATLTPIAFLKFAAGAGAGSGWDIGFAGLGINEAGTIVPQDFGGIVYRAWVKGTFQFDLAAVLPGDWNHLVVLASPKVEYQAYSRADADLAWIWEADEAMNFNGFKLKGSYFLGYQMPIVLDTLGILLETEGWLGSVRDRAPSDGSKALKWGSDITTHNFGPVLNFRINDASSIAVLVQLKTGIKWTDDTTRQKHFENRVYEDSYLYFNRVALDYNLKL